MLDSEALSVLAERSARSSVLARVQAVLEAVARRGGVAIIPAPVLAEVSRGRRAAAVSRVVNKLVVVPTDRAIAQAAGDLLERHRLDSTAAVDAFVVATAAARRPAVILTGDPDDLTLLASTVPNVAVQCLP